MLLPILLGQPTGPRALVLDAQPASFTYGGQSATVSSARVIDLGASSYSVTGQPATLSLGRSLNLAAGSFSEAGQPATLTSARALTLDSVGYSITGQSANLQAGRALNLASSSLALGGQDATVLYSRRLSIDAQPAGFALGGQDATLFYSRRLSIDAQPAGYSVTGLPAELTRTTALNNYVLDAASVSLTVAGQDATFLRSHVAYFTGASFSISGQNATASAGRKLQADSGAFALSGAEAGMVYSTPHVEFNAEPGHFDIIGQAATLAAHRRLNLQQANDGRYVADGYAVSGYVAPLGYTSADYVAVGYVTPGYAGKDTGATLTASRVLAANAGSIVFAGMAAALHKTGLVSITQQQAIWIEQIARLHGLVDPLTVSQTGRGDGTIVQTLAQESGNVTIHTTESAASDVFDASLIDDLAAIYGLTNDCVVNASGRTAGSVSQSFSVSNGITTVTRLA